MIRYAVVDTETSGLPKWNLPAEDPQQPHVASLVIILATEGDDGVFIVESEYETLIKPAGWIIEPGAAAVNGLTMERLEAEGIPVENAVVPYEVAIDEGRTIVAFNAQFDCKMMRGALRRVALAQALADGTLDANSTQDEINAICEPAARFEITRNACAMRAAGEIMKLAPSDKMMAAGYKKNKPPKLSEALEYFTGSAVVDAHTALGDARACLHILRGLRLRGVDMSGAVHHAKEGTKAGDALAARKPKLAADGMPENFGEGEV